MTATVGDEVGEVVVGAAAAATTVVEVVVAAATARHWVEVAVVVADWEAAATDPSGANHQQRLRSKYSDPGLTFLSERTGTRSRCGAQRALVCLSRKKSMKPLYVAWPGSGTQYESTAPLRHVYANAILGHCCNRGSSKDFVYQLESCCHWMPDLTPTSHMAGSLLCAAANSET